MNKSFHNISLRDLVFKGAKSKNIKVNDLVLDRISNELNIIEKKGFTEYFILYSKIIEVSNELELIRSYGRGSAPASLVNYCLDITNINPLEHNFSFEKFIHPLQTRLPDIDIDIPVESRVKIINKIGSDFSEYKLYSIAYRPENIDILSDRVYVNEKEYIKHEYGTIITKDKINDQIVLYNNEMYYLCDDYKNDIVLDQKFDLIELEILNCIQNIVSKLGSKWHPIKLPLNDFETFNSLKLTDTKDIFGFNFENSAEIFKRFEVDSIEDLYLIFAMNRPPLNNYIQKVIENKNSSTKYRWTDKRVETILSESYGLLVYQETFFDLLIDIAGFDFIEADSWRKTLYYTDNKENQVLFIMKFTEKCKENSILSEQEIANLTAIIIKTTKWTFQKTHSISHALLGYWSAFYKTHFPIEFEQTFN